ncbi:ClbS/DfsB family four-helix bundle protein [Tenacibaculum halocynthiae]
MKITYSRLKIDLHNIPSELANRKELEGHSKDTKISVSDLVSYLIGWDN